MSISKDFFNFVFGRQAAPAPKPRHPAKPGTVAAMNREEFKALMQQVLTPGRTKPRFNIRLKQGLVPAHEHHEGLGLLLDMTPAQRQQVADRLSALPPDDPQLAGLPGDLKIRIARMPAGERSQVLALEAKLEAASLQKGLLTGDLIEMLQKA